MEFKHLIKFSKTVDLDQKKIVEKNTLIPIYYFTIELDEKMNNSIIRRIHCRNFPTAGLDWKICSLAARCFIARRLRVVGPFFGWKLRKSFGSLYEWVRVGSWIVYEGKEFPSISTWVQNVLKDLFHKFFPVDSFFSCFVLLHLVFWIFGERNFKEKKIRKILKINLTLLLKMNCDVIDNKDRITIQEDVFRDNFSAENFHERSFKFCG